MRDVGEVVRGEVRLAKAEMSEKVSKASKAGGMFGGAAVCGLMGLAALVTAAIAALALALPLWASAGIVGLVLLALAGMMYAGGRAKIKDVTPVPERTVETLKDDVEWAKHPTR
jgi:apolipoprotein N-acyltransferase